MQQTERAKAEHSTSLEHEPARRSHPHGGGGTTLSTEGTGRPLSSLDAHSPRTWSQCREPGTEWRAQEALRRGAGLFPGDTWARITDFSGRAQLKFKDKESASLETAGLDDDALLYLSCGLPHCHIVPTCPFNLEYILVCRSRYSQDPGRRIPAAPARGFSPGSRFKVSLARK